MGGRGLGSRRRRGRDAVLTAGVQQEQGKHARWDRSKERVGRPEI